MANSKTDPKKPKERELKAEPVNSSVKIVRVESAEEVKPGPSAEEAKSVVTTPQEPIEVVNEHINQHLLDCTNDILLKLKIKQIYFIDDAANFTNDKATFISLVKTAIDKGEIAQLKQITIQNGINFQLEAEVLVDHIDEVWDNINVGKRYKYLGKLLAITGEPQGLSDINVSDHLKDFFKDGLLTTLTPNQWDDQCEEIIANIPADERILILFDQDLTMAQGRFEGGAVKGEHLILETIQREIPNKVILALFTHTVPSFPDELPERHQICLRHPNLKPKDFFVLSKSRLQKHDLLTDGLKKTCLNTFCEEIKTATVEIIQEAQKKMIDHLNSFDTYAFDETIFKSSFAEGVWEPETLLRITDVIFKDEVRNLMLGADYVPKINALITASREVSDVKFDIDQNNPINIHLQKFNLRHQELYESQTLLNKLRRPIDNGDIFRITNGDNEGKIYILIGQECDLMVRSEDPNKGIRGSKTALIAEIEVYAQDQLFAAMKRTYQSQIEKKRFTNHYFADRYKLEYFDEGKDTIGVISFKNPLVVDLMVLDLMVFNPDGIAAFNVDAPVYNSTNHNYAWQSRYEIINAFFTKVANGLDGDYAALAMVENGERRAMIQTKINLNFSFIDKAGISLNYQNRVFNFGIQRISRLRLPKSKDLLDRYSSHLARYAEQHDFANSQ